MSSQQKFSFVIGICVIIGIGAFLFMWSYQKDYAVLFAGLSEAETAKVIDELDAMKVDYKLTEGGDKILVGAEHVNKTRLKLVSQGLPMKGGVGFELFDNTDYGMTEFAQKINYQRALQGELARTIGTLEEIKHVRVHLVVPEASLFKKDQRAPKAAVTLIMEPGMTLSQAQIAGIQQLVSGAVNGLESNMVTLVNSRGETLSTTKGDDQAYTSDRLAQKQKVESYLVSKVSNVLTQVFGPGKAIVNIDVTLNYDQVQRTEENYLKPSGKNNAGFIVKSKKNKNYTKDSGVATENVEHEYRLGRTVEKVAEAVGGIERLTVSVLVPEETSIEELLSLEKIISAGVGINLDRGDVIEIKPIALQFNTDASDNGVIFPEVTTDINKQIVSQPATASGGSISNDATLTELLNNNKMTVIALGIFIILLIAVALILTNREKNLTPQERQQLLKEVQDWLNVDATAGRS